MGSFWNIVLDVQKQLFLNEKFLSQVGDDGLYLWILQLLLVIVWWLDLQLPMQSVRIPLRWYNIM
jgi:hypothetical protein